MKVIVITLLVAGAAANLAMVAIAVADPGFSTPPDYYERAVKWDDVMAQAQRNAALGWRVAMTGEADALRLTITQRDGRPLDRATVDLDAWAVARGKDRTHTSAREQDAGSYEATVRLPTRGLWDVALRVRRGDEIYEATLRHEAK